MNPMYDRCNCKLIFIFLGGAAMEIPPFYHPARPKLEDRVKWKMKKGSFGTMIGALGTSLFDKTHVFKICEI